MTTVCFDFDGVLAEYDEWKDGEIGKPIPEGVVLANGCRAMGYKIVISTCRTHQIHGGLIGQITQAQMIQNWLNENKVPFDWIEMDGKPIADVYVDDRGLYFDQNMGKNMKGYGSYLMALIAERVKKNE